MVKKFLLEIQPEPSLYTMLGISCHLMDYRLSYLINLHTGFFLEKKEDLLTRSFKNKNESSFSFYHYDDEDNYCNYLLVANRSEEFVLVPEVKHVDFLFLIEGEIKTSRKDQLLKKFRGIPNVLTAFELKPEQIKNTELLFSDIEMHMTYLNRTVRLGKVNFPKTIAG